MTGSARHSVNPNSNASSSTSIAPPPPPEGGARVTVTDLCALPPAPVQVSVKVAVALIVGDVALPLAGSLPDQLPLATHEVAFWLVHTSVTVPPEPTLVALLCRLTVG